MDLFGLILCVLRFCDKKLAETVTHGNYATHIVEA